MKQRFLLRAAAFALGALALAAHASAPPNYRITTPGSLNSVVDVGSTGQVLGTVWDGSTPWHPAIYANGSVMQLPMPFQWQAYQFDSSGAVFGIRTDTAAPQLVRYQNGTFTTLLDNLAAGDDSFHMNNAGLLAASHGPCTPSDCKPHAVIYDSQGMRDLGTLGGRVSSPTGINSAGHVIGYSYLPDAQETLVPFFYRDGQMVRLPTVLDPSQAEVLGDARAINDHDQIVGTVVTDAHDLNNIHTRAALWENGVLKDLGTLGGRDSSAWDINNRGVILGVAGTVANPNGGNDLQSALFLYQDGQMYNFESLVLPDGNQWRFSDLGDLNDEGYMVGYAYRNGEPFPIPVLLSPVPEPAQWALLALGLAAVAGVGRRRRT